MVREMPDETYVSVIIPAYQAESHILDVLLSLKNQEYPLDKFEIIVITSGDVASLNICKSFQNFMPNLSIYHYTKRISAGYARNIGASYAKGDICLFIDSDCIAPPNWINLIKEDFEAFPEVYGIIGTYSGGKSLLEKIIGGELIANEKKINIFPSLIEGNCAFKKVIFEKGCKFGDITYGEITTLTHCMKKNNFKMLLDPELQVTHLGTFSFLKYCKMGKLFYFWYLNSKTTKQAIITAAFKSSFVMFSLFLLFLIPFFAYFTTFTIFGLPISYFFISPFIFVNLIFVYYIKQDYLISTKNKLKFFPFLILLRWIHQLGYFIASLEAISCSLKKGNKTYD